MRPHAELVEHEQRVITGAAEMAIEERPYMARGRYGPIWLSVTLPVESMAIVISLSPFIAFAVMPSGVETIPHLSVAQAFQLGLNLVAHVSNCGSRFSPDCTVRARARICAGLSESGEGCAEQHDSDDQRIWHGNLHVGSGRQGNPDPSCSVPLPSSGARGRTVTGLPRLGTYLILPSMK